MKTLILFLISTLSLPLMAQRCLGDLDLSIAPALEEFSVSMSDVSWTQSEMYEGNVIIFSTKSYVGKAPFKDVDEDGYRTQYFLGKMQTEVQLSDNGLEHAYLKIQSISREKVRELEKDARFHVINKTVDVGNVQISRDRPLAQSSYLELEPIRIHGAIGYSPSENSHLEFVARAAASVGYAFAHSTKDFVPDSHKLYIGQEYGFTIKHDKFGQIDFDRGVDGDIKKYDPSSNKSREAYVKAGYTFHFNDNSSLSLAAEKRSFRFGPEYEKSRRYLLTYQRKFR